MEIDGTQKGEELYSMLGEFREVFVDHIKSTLEHVLQDGGHLILHERLRYMLVVLDQDVARQTRKEGQLHN